MQPLRAATGDDAMELYATGFNAWNQLIFDAAKPNEENKEPDDIFRFIKVLGEHTLERPFAHLCYTSVQRDSHWCLAGATPSPLTLDIQRIVPSSAEAANGAILTIECEEVDLSSLGKPLHPLVRYPSISAWESRSDAQSWPSKVPVKQIAAYDTGFVILYEDGSVSTLGDPRFEDCLGRDVSDSSPADEPGQVTDLNDLEDPVTKVAAGGYIGAALTEGGGLYVWGAKPPGSHSHQVFADISQTPNYVEVDGDKDVKDVSLGESHAIALTTDGCIYVVGKNDNGQLGLGEDTNIAETWAKVDFTITPGWKVVGVEAGPRSSFVTISQISPWSSIIAGKPQERVPEPAH
ncbi:hypothetical protein G7046_g1038 [Stylonectria norvegica]|nr:hypothetical protein G7046_g1038 [Stylonectria norvegica]